MIQKLHFDIYYLLQPFPLDSEGREDLTANISQAFLKFIFFPRLRNSVCSWEEGGRLKKFKGKDVNKVQ